MSVVRPLDVNEEPSQLHDHGGPWVVCDGIASFLPSFRLSVLPLHQGSCCAGSWRPAGDGLSWWAMSWLPSLSQCDIRVTARNLS